MIVGKTFKYPLGVGIKFSLQKNHAMNEDNNDKTKNPYSISQEMNRNHYEHSPMQQNQDNHQIHSHESTSFLYIRHAETMTANEFVRQTATSSTSNSRVDHAQQLRSSAPNSSNGHLQKQKISTASNSYMSDHEQRYRGKYKTFVQLLYSILEADKYSDIISWLSNGDCWEIKNRQRFISEILPSVCVKSSQWKAFLRQLSGWGFKRG